MEDSVYKALTGGLLLFCHKKLPSKPLWIFMQKYISRIHSPLLVLWISVIFKNVIKFQASSCAREPQKGNYAKNIPLCWLESTNILEHFTDLIMLQWIDYNIWAPYGKDKEAGILVRNKRLMDTG